MSFNTSDCELQNFGTEPGSVSQQHCTSLRSTNISNFCVIPIKFYQNLVRRLKILKQGHQQKCELAYYLCSLQSRLKFLDVYASDSSYCIVYDF